MSSRSSEDIGWSLFDAHPIGRLLQVEGERVVVHLESPDLLLALAQRQPQVLYFRVKVGTLLQLGILNLDSPGCIRI